MSAKLDDIRDISKIPAPTYSGKRAGPRRYLAVQMYVEVAVTHTAKALWMSAHVSPAG